ncbi:MAG TPA: CPBP family intramembrane glutamic endopeptidase [Thermoanaerobaculia bacterium]|nr:CPBP family intramembrane glutamic endopeptidase [Thermoanaerobaculia bacterium]
MTTAAALLVLLWARLTRKPWSELGLAPPRNWLATVALGVTFGAAFKIVMKAVVMPLVGADPINHTYAFLAGNPAAAAAILALVIAAGFGEEIVFRAFLFDRLGKLIRSKTAIVLITTALFAAAHDWDQGLPGVEQAVLTGLVFGSIYAVTGRLWIPICAHAAFDVTAVAIIYWNAEAELAHLMFK